MALVAIRGATQVEANTRELILRATGDLISELMARNDLSANDLISMFFTVTPDLDAEFPAVAARMDGLRSVPLMSAVEIAVPGALPKVVRLLAYAETERPRSEVEHVYLRGASALRPDLAVTTASVLRAQTDGSGADRPVSDLLARGRAGHGRISGRQGGPIKHHVTVSILVADRPGELAMIFQTAAVASINIEDVTIEHSPGRPVGVVELAVEPRSADRLAVELRARGWSVPVAPA